MKWALGRNIQTFNFHLFSLSGSLQIENNTIWNIFFQRNSLCSQSPPFQNEAFCILRPTEPLIETETCCVGYAILVLLIVTPSVVQWGLTAVHWIANLYVSSCNSHFQKRKKEQKMTVTYGFLFFPLLCSVF